MSIRWEIRKKKNGIGRYFYLSVRQKNGARRRFYVRYSELGDVQRDYQKYEQDRKNEELARRESKSEKKREKNLFYPEPLASILRSAGFSVKGSRLQINRQRYFTIEAARIRFGLLEVNDKMIIGSPERLLTLCRCARSMLKSANRRGEKQNYDSCFSKVCIIYKETIQDQ